MHLRLVLLIALAATAGEATAEPLEPPTTKTTIRVEREREGSCSEIRAGKPGVAPVLRMTDVCHGWTSSTCDDKLLILGQGVVEDQAQVLLTDKNRAINAVQLVDQGIRARWPVHEHLHLMFGAARCGQSALVLPVSGSHLRAGASGSASGFVGVLRIRSGRGQQVQLKPEP